MTGSALDEILPGRIVMGLGTGLPLRLKQMGIPYEPDGGRRAACRRRSTSSARCGPASGCRRRRPGLPPIQPMFPPTHRIPLVIAAYRQGVRGPGRPEGRRLPGPAGRVDPVAARDPRAAPRGGRRGRPRPGCDRDGRLPAVAGRRDPARGAQPGEARAVRHLHDVGPVRRLAPAGRVRGRPARPDRRRLASRGLHDRRQPHPGRAPRRVHAVRHPRGRRGQGDGLPRRGRPRAAAPPAGPPGGPPDRRADRRGRAVRRAAGAGRQPGGRAAGPSSTRPGVPEPRTTATPSRPASPTTARLGTGSLLRRRAGALWEILRPFAYTASVIPVLAGAALAAVDGLFAWAPFIAALARGRPPPLRHEHRQRDLRRPQGHRHDHQPAGQPRHRQGPADRAGRLRVALGGVRPGDRRRRSTSSPCAGRRSSSSACSGWPAATSTRRRRSSTSSMRSASRSCSC